MTYQYKGYNPNNAKHVNKYETNHYKRVPVLFDKDYYNNILKPACESLGVPVSTFIKQAVDDALGSITKK